MDQFDVDGMFNGSVVSSWMMPAFDQQDANFLTSSRQMLEPIIEETSEDDEESNLSFTHYENSVWSSESETGSVIRIELHNDQDSISERDFACPAKRARRDDLLNINNATSHLSTNAIMHNNNANDFHLLYESPKKHLQHRNHKNDFLTINDNDSIINPLSLSTTTNYRRRFDELMYSDSDSLSYNSLSRSSSLIQFESLERQFQNDLSSVGSSPSLLSFDSTTVEERGSHKGSNSSLKRFESSDGRLHQTYYDLDKIDFDNTTNLLFNGNTTTKSSSNNAIIPKILKTSTTNSSTISSTLNTVTATTKSCALDVDERQSKSDSESSSTDNSILSHEERIVVRRPINLLSSSTSSSSPPSCTSTAHASVNETMRSSYKGKSSVENLSEDSGYCEHNNNNYYYTALRTKSKSIPNFLRSINSYEKFYEEDEFENHKSLEQLYIKNENNCNNNAETHYKRDEQKNNFINETLSLSPPSSPWYNVVVQQDKNKFSSTSPSEESSAAADEYDYNDDDDDDDDDEENDEYSDCANTSAQFSWSTNTNTNQMKNIQYNNMREISLPLSSSSSSPPPPPLPPLQKAMLLNSNVQYNSSSLPDVRGGDQILLNDNNGTQNKNSNNKSINKKCNNYCISENISESINNYQNNINTRYLSSSNCDLNNKYINNDIYDNDKYLNTVCSVPKDLNLLNNCENFISINSIGSSCDDINYNTNNDHHVNSTSALIWKKNFNNSENRITKKREESFINNFEKQHHHQHHRQHLDYFEFSQSAKSLNSGLNYMNESYNNLTLLDYSIPNHNNNSFTKMSSSSSSHSSQSSQSSTSSKENEKLKIYNSDNVLLNNKNNNNENNQTEKRSSSNLGDYGLGKGNFLLDEISAHFDKNISILNDREQDSDFVSEFIEKEKKIPPKPPVRKSSTNRENRYSASIIPTKTNLINIEDNKSLQKPKSLHTTFDIDPTNLRTTYTESLEKCNFDPKEVSTTDLTELTNQITTIAIKHSTPIKRNFVASTPNLHSFNQQQEIDDISDDNDFKISSASNSLIQLPQDKKLGILISSNSKNSLGKSVNFCPVVAEYSWHEKSEECDDENYEPDSLEDLNNLPNDHSNNDSTTILVDNSANKTVVFGYGEDVTDSYTNKNTDNKYNHTNDSAAAAAAITKEKHTIIKENSEKRELLPHNKPQVIQQQQTTNDHKNMGRVKRETTFAASNSAEPQTVIIPDTNNYGCSTTTVAANQEVITKKDFSNTSFAAKTRNKTNSSTATTVSQCIDNSKQKKIMETNIDNEYTQYSGGGGSGIHHKNDKKLIEATRNLMTNERYNHNNNNNYNSNGNFGAQQQQSQQVKRNYNQQQLLTTTVPINPANNSELINTKFKPKPDEKHHRSFLSRFTGGFRFSLRRKNKKPIDKLVSADQQSPDQNNKISSKKKSVADGAIKTKSNNNRNSPDFIYIPLKGSKTTTTTTTTAIVPTETGTTAAAAASRVDQNNFSIEYQQQQRPIAVNSNIDGSCHLNESTAAAVTTISPAENAFYTSTPKKMNNSNNNNNNNNNNHVLLTGKPPLPKQPPRVVGVSEKMYQQMRAGQHAYRSLSQPRDDYDDRNSFFINHQQNRGNSNSREFLENERRYYHQDHNNTTMNGIGGCYQNQINDGYAPPPAQFLDETNDDNKNNCKIGLIETNLDTHETVITGKTRSLMELGPHHQQQQQQQRYKLIKNHNLNLQNNDKHHSNVVHDDDDGPTNRRPHKSMEFLLDKENQKNIAENIAKTPTPKTYAFQQPMAKIPLRNTLKWKNDDSIVEKTSIENKTILESPRTTNMHGEEFTIKKCSPPNSPSASTKARSEINSENCSFVEIDPGLLRDCQSPRRIQRAYTLTAMASPTATDCEFPTPRLSLISNFSSYSSRSCSALPSNDELGSMKDLEWQPFDKSVSVTWRPGLNYNLSKSWQNLTVMEKTEDFFNDVTLEANDIENQQDSIRQVKFINSTVTAENQTAPKVFRKTPRKPNSGNFGAFSTPNKMQQKFECNKNYDGKNPQWSTFSPIQIQMNEQKLNREKRSIWSQLEDLYICEESKENSVRNSTTETLKNDNSVAFEKVLTPMKVKPCTIQTIYENPKFSQFWIFANNCQIKFNIFHLSEEKLMNLKNKFAEKSSYGPRNYTCGIDDMKYPANNHCNTMFPKKINPTTSTYWFAVNDFVVAFDGELITKKKIFQVFNLLKGTNFRFGIDSIEFSQPPSSIATTMNQHQMVNGSSACSKTSDLEQSEFESDSDQNDLKNRQYGPINRQTTYEIRSSVSSSIDDNCRNSMNTYDSADSGEVMSVEDSDGIDTLDHLFDWLKTNTLSTEKKLSSPITCEKSRNHPTKGLMRAKKNIDELLNYRLMEIEDKFNQRKKLCGKLSNPLNSLEDDMYAQSVIKSINLIGKNGYEKCNEEQLENFVCTLYRHANLTVANCIFNVNQIFDVLKPPENELQKSHDNTAALSEHQLRVQASLQRLNIPDWYRTYSSTAAKTDGSNLSNSYKPGNFTRKRASESGRWTGLNSKTTSLSSLGSQRSDRSPLLLSPSAHSHHGGAINQHNNYINQNVGVGSFSRWSTSYLNSTQTSPSVSQRGSFSRGGPINSSFNSTGGGITSGGSIRNSFRQPYMGWRSQEKINQPRTPHERLASSILAHKPPPRPQSATSAATAVSVTPEIQSSIKEVTSAIVHYVNDQNRNTNSRSRSTSPSSRKCWLESSFVGIHPLESPQTPTLENNAFTATATTGNLSQTNQLQNSANHSSTGYSPQLQQAQYHHNQSADIRMNGVGVSPLTSMSIAPVRSPSSASLEDVLASLLGLPPTESSSSYRSTGDTVNEMITFRVTQPPNQQQLIRNQELPPPPPGTTPITIVKVNNNLTIDQQSRLRRCSEGDAAQRQKQQQQIQQQQQQQQQNKQQSDNSTAITSSSQLQVQAPRRISLDSSDSKTTSELMIKCRNTKCDQTSNPVDAKKYYKSCHNCSHLYCSRDCRRAHWEKHRKACLHSRVSNLCRQVLSSCKDDVDTLRHLSLLARKGYLSQGRGVVRILFRSPESAENFIKNGFQCMGEASYVRWPDLMPAEMGLELYSELLRLSTEYKTDTKMLLYVAICVVSEAPGTAQAPVKWERQLVSRCAKLKLCKTILNEFSDQQNVILAASIQPEVSTEILILTFNLQPLTTTTTATTSTTIPVKYIHNQREIILQNISNILSKRGVILKKHYPEVYQRLQSFVDGQTERFMPVTLHPRDSQTGQGFVCIIMPNESIKLPASDIGNQVCTVDVGEELLES